MLSGFTSAAIAFCPTAHVPPREPNRRRQEGWTARLRWPKPTAVTFASQKGKAPAL